jgi:hypothetical protein
MVMSDALVPAWLVQGKASAAMTNATLPADRSAEGDFRIGRVFWRTASIILRNFPVFFIVIVVTSLPTLLSEGSLGSAHWHISLPLLDGLLSTVCQAVVLYAAFQAMRGRRVNLAESARLGLRRILPIIGISICVTVIGTLGLLLFILPGLMWLSRWFVAIPACVVESLGVSASMGRSAQLTENHRWGIAGALVLFVVLGVILESGIDELVSLATGGVPALAIRGLWEGMSGTFYAIFAVVAYHDLRVAREGVDIEQIAAVFE